MFSKFFLSGEPRLLLHLLFDGQVSRVHPQRRNFILFAFLGAVAAGTFFGGPVGDRMGRKV